uniref:Golgin-84 n=1 Tax=Syphacia muris TaxID=451379 RepID=A0A0N5AZF4_9BILA
MSWLNKVTDIAEKAENLLNKLDQNAADALKKPRIGNSTSVQSFQHGESQPTFLKQNDDRYSESGIGLSTRRYSRSIHGGASSVKSFGDRRADEDELITFLNDGKHSAVLTRSPSVVSHASISKTGRTSTPSPKEEMLPLKPSEEEKAQYSDVLKSLHLKESEIAVIRVSLQEAEESLKRKEARIMELTQENQVLRSDYKFHVSSDEDTTAALQRLTNERQREKEDFETRLNEYAKRFEKMRGEKNSLFKEIESLRMSATAMEQKLKLQDEELRLAKYNLEANKSEFDEYKQKAQKILNAKEQLLVSLKENSAESGENSSDIVELEELRCENGLLKEDVQQSQLLIYNLKADIQDLENRLREEQKSSCSQREALLEQDHKHQSVANQYREQLERIQLEYEFLQAEMRRQEEAVERKLAEKDVEMTKLMEERKWGRKYESGETEERLAALGEKLIAKQTKIERLEGEKRALSLRLERLERTHWKSEAVNGGDYSIDMHDLNAPAQHRSIFTTSVHDGFIIRLLKGILIIVDSLGTVVQSLYFLVETFGKFNSSLSLFRLRLANFLKSPVFRIFFCIYYILLHVWLFFIILTYTPEIHPL